MAAGKEKKVEVVVWPAREKGVSCKCGRQG
jgi:hypothetical protein